MADRALASYIKKRRKEGASLDQIAREVQSQGYTREQVLAAARGPGKAWLVVAPLAVAGLVLVWFVLLPRLDLGGPLEDYRHDFAISGAQSSCRGGSVFVSVANTGFDPLEGDDFTIAVDGVPADPEGVDIPVGAVARILSYRCPGGCEGEVTASLLAFQRTRTVALSCS